jgi:hypothetical protein
MLTGDIRNQVDTIWNSFWTGRLAGDADSSDFQIAIHFMSMQCAA